MIKIGKTEDLSLLVEKYSKYQKVMLVFDKFTSNLQIAKIYNTIKNLCIFNQIEVDKLLNNEGNTNKNLEEVYNGYKMLIFLCTPENVVNLNLNLEEFVNVFICQNALLPYCLNKNHMISQAETFLLQDFNILDKSAFSSLAFNCFYNYILNLVAQQDSDVEFKLQEFTNNNLLYALTKLPNDFKFIDIEILAASNMDYQTLPIIDFVLIAGLEAFFCGVKQHNFLFADIYKTAKSNIQLINKYYALSQNDAIITMVELNFGFLQNKLNSAKQIVYKFLQFKPTDDVVKIIQAVKTFAKNSNGILNYLYLYNVFET